MGKKTNQMIQIIFILGSLAAIISLFVFWLYPSYLEPVRVNIVSHPPTFGVFDFEGSNLGIIIKNVGKANFKSCIKLKSLDENVKILRDYDCNEFFNKGELHETQFIINSTSLFSYNPTNFTLVYQSNSGWEYGCVFVRTADNFYSGQSCTFPTSKVKDIVG